MSVELYEASGFHHLPAFEGEYVGQKRRSGSETTKPDGSLQPGNHPVDVFDGSKIDRRKEEETLRRSTLTDFGWVRNLICTTVLGFFGFYFGSKEV